MLMKTVTVRTLLDRSQAQNQEATMLTVWRKELKSRLQTYGGEKISLFPMTLERIFTNTLTTLGRTCTLTVGVLTQMLIQRMLKAWTNMRGETRNFFP
jgi:hypothetical protein